MTGVHWRLEGHCKFARRIVLLGVVVGDWGLNHVIQFF